MSPRHTMASRDTLDLKLRTYTTQTCEAMDSTRKVGSQQQANTNKRHIRDFLKCTKKSVNFSVYRRRTNKVTTPYGSARLPIVA